jgi:glucokinase
LAEAGGSATVEAVGVDVGGTKVNALRVAPSGEVLGRISRPTPSRDMQATLEVLVDAARGVMSPNVKAIGVGAAGLIDRRTKILISAPNLVWRDADLGSVLTDAFGLPTSVDNDCTAGAYAEWRIGAARGFDDVLYVGIGTGIGGGMVVGGRLARGAFGLAGEIGHVIVEPDGPRCGCGNRGCWETVASGTAITLHGRRAVTRHAHSMIAELAGGDPEAATGATVAEAAAGGDPAARGIFVEVGTRLGEGIAGLVNVLDPSIVVVGGAPAEAGELLLAPARAAYLRTVEGRELRPAVAIVRAALGPDAAAIGAALLAHDEVGG